MKSSCWGAGDAAARPAMAAIARRLLVEHISNRKNDRPQVWERVMIEMSEKNECGANDGQRNMEGILPDYLSFELGT